jgi:hypothetical protein
VATKQENAEALTVDQLRAFADEKGIDLTGAANKGDIVEVIVANASAEELASAQPTADTTVSSDTTVSDKRLTRTAGMTEEEKVKAGLSPADLEVAGASGLGPRIEKRVNSETPTQYQVDAATGTQQALGTSKVKIEDADGGVTEYEVSPDVGRQLVSSVESAQGHPSFALPGHVGNPNLMPMTDEEREENEKRYADRFAS